MTVEELQARREKGLCYYCSDKYAKGHRCRCQYMVLLTLEHRSRVDEESPNSRGHPHWVSLVH